ncbi:MAG: ABC transporter substrate-binding protein [Rhodococcus sp.]|nr:ABC transporter substrate-binding protein [Rhodococcus sp. (in: high G+C Gram-positive bacteria)]
MKGNKNGVRRMGRMLAVLGAAALVATACGTSDDDDTTAATNTDFTPVTITHAFGETVIDAVPERIVALGVTSTDAVLALDGNLVGAAASPVSPTGMSPWQEGILDPDKTELLPMDQLGGFELEKILALDPDIVFAQEAGNAQQLYEALEGTVPVVPFHETLLGDSWQTVTTDVALALGKKAQGEQLISSVESVTADAPEGLKDKTWVFLAAPAPGMVNAIRTEEDPMSQFFAEYGMVLVPTVSELPDNAQNPGTAAISEENYDALAADLVIVAAGSDAASQQLVSSPIFELATADSVVWTTDMTVAMALRSPTVLATPWVADQLQTELEEVAARRAP